MDFIDFLKDHGDIIAIAIAVLGFLLYGIRWLITLDLRMKDLEPIRKNAQAIAETPEKVERLSKTVVSLSKTVESLSKTVGGLSRTMESLSKTVGGLSITVGGLSKTVGHIHAKIDKLPEDIFRHSSPLSLSEYGQKLSDKIDAPAIASKYKRQLISVVKEQNMRPYQIQQSCFDFSKKEIISDLKENDEEQYNKLTDVAFNEGVEVEVLMKITGLVLRDQVLEAFNEASEREMVSEKRTVPYK